MSSPPDPWTADRELDVAGAARAIREALPEFAEAEVRLLGEGWDFDAYEVDARWVFRFPRRAEEQARLRRDLTLLPWLGQHVDIPIPQPAWGPLSAPSFPYVFSGYAKLPGVNASALPPDSVDLDALGTALGRSFRDLHALKPPAAVRAVLAGSAPRPADPRAELRRYLPTFVAHAPPRLAARATRFFDMVAVRPPPPSDAICLCHDDLHAEHILLSSESPRQVTGWLDWSDAALADPASDFAAIYSWGGEALLGPMLAAYGEADAAFEARARFRGLCVAFIDFDHWTRQARANGMAWTMHVLDAALP